MLGTHTNGTTKKFRKVVKEVKPKPRDPDLKLVLEAIKGKSAYKLAKSVNNNISPGTITKWQSGVTRRPTHFTMTMALKAVGKEWSITSIE